jgi:cation diffusion facilitator family transporter
MSCECEIDNQDGEQKTVLVALLAINGIMFVLELAIGVFAESTALIADALDMLADATVYGISLYAVGRAGRHKTNAAFVSGIMQIVLGLGVIAEVVRRFFTGSEPEPLFMVGVGLVALVANSICLMLIAKHRDGEIHMRASWIFSRNDVLANLGVIIAGLLVGVFQNSLPDLIIGSVIAIVVASGGRRILREVNEARTISVVASDKG